MGCAHLSPDLNQIDKRFPLSWENLPDEKSPFVCLQGRKVLQVDICYEIFGRNYQIFKFQSLL
jgi:hypothetical protein